MRHKGGCLVFRETVQAALCKCDLEKVIWIILWMLWHDSSRQNYDYRVPQCTGSNNRPGVIPHVISFNTAIFSSCYAHVYVLSSRNTNLFCSMLWFKVYQGMFLFHFLHYILQGSTRTYVLKWWFCQAELCLLTHPPRAAKGENFDVTYAGWSAP